MAHFNSIQEYLLHYSIKVESTWLFGLSCNAMLIDAHFGTKEFRLMNSINNKVVGLKRHNHGTMLHNLNKRRSE